MKRKNLISSIVMAGAILATSVALAPAASADPTASICGSGYHTVYGPKWVYSYYNVYAGDVYIAYNSSNGYNCAYLNLGSSTTKGSLGWQHSIQIKSANGRSSSPDGGYFNSYAGPVYVYSPSDCVAAVGYITDPKANDKRYDTLWQACS
ncbi:hypothetical protein NE236_05235 [Actinoallomurus purpureus]|uniref:hypothetical protein n=1 Tax=Actinoallomurus purpureus TaxID=478114 RepID=UPI002093AE11|nr:hypothetical protein [Actinoallomurus purpureus]MCO6004379.1 hypothetical protein [Actinoallomurus purpureus]